MYKRISTIFLSLSWQRAQRRATSASACLNVVGKLIRYRTPRIHHHLIMKIIPEITTRNMLSYAEVAIRKLHNLYEHRLHLQTGIMDRADSRVWMYLTMSIREILQNIYCWIVSVWENVLELVDGAGEENGFLCLQHPLNATVIETEMWILTLWCRDPKIS